ncbi:MAG: DUF3027 domain-containing protein [Propionibacteriaceae bacterium]|jgi:hypothetical protein|nr:DUF3027 domain-containing protein [Propionibacteriaceae bacterium]
MAATLVVDKACAEAVELAQAAAIRRSGVFGVGDHIKVEPEDVRVATHYFECTHPGYPGWTWAITVARASRARVVTVNEIALIPGETAFIGPDWVPWSDRIEIGDLTPGMLHPAADDDPRLEPGFTGGEHNIDVEPAEMSQIRALIAELGLGRERVLSLEGHDEAAERWESSAGGPGNPMTHQAPALCNSCGFFISLAGRLGTYFGVCANRYSPQDGEVVTRDHGCGGHSDAPDARALSASKVPIWDTATTDNALFD